MMILALVAVCVNMAVASVTQGEKGGDVASNEGAGLVSLNPNEPDTLITVSKDSTVIAFHADSLPKVNLDSTLQALKGGKLKGKGPKPAFVPNPKKALWLSLILPGAGQIYNRKYWKLPIIYGGFLGCTYALLWNQQMYDDYSQAYIDIMDDDPNTASYRNILPMGYDITGREEQFKKIFKHKRDYYRKYRDMSIFAFFGVYLLSVVDAYVDAQLSTFDISKDLSLTVEPSSFEQEQVGAKKKSRAVGLQCSLKF